MWQLFTDRARLAIYYAKAEAVRWRETYVGTEHLMLGLVQDENNVAVRILKRLNLSPDDLRSDIDRQLTSGHGAREQEMQLTPRAKKVLDLAHEEAQLQQHDFVGTGHILLGLMRQGDGLGALVLKKRGVVLERVRQEVSALQDEEKQASFQEDVQQLIDGLSGDRDEAEARVTWVLLCADRDGVPWWQVQADPPFRAEALLGDIKARGFPEAEVAADHLIWVRPVREDEHG